MKTWFAIFVVSAIVALVTLVLPVGGLNYLATFFFHGSLLAMIIQGAGRNAQDR
jgi:hypothetical protein